MKKIISIILVTGILNAHIAFAEEGKCEESSSRGAGIATGAIVGGLTGGLLVGPGLVTLASKIFSMGRNEVAIFQLLSMFAGGGLGAIGGGVAVAKLSKCPDDEAATQKPSKRISSGQGSKGGASGLFSKLAH